MSIIIHSLKYIHSDKEVLFDQLNLSIAKGQKATLVGDNGAGKTTLLQLIAGELSPTDGEIIVPDRPWFVPQHLGQFDHLSIAQVLNIDKKLMAIKAITAGDSNPAFFDDLEDDWEIEDKLNATLQFWGLDHSTPDQLLRELSGGEKTKVFLCGILLKDPRIILLDEPSNHLDAESRLKLYELLSNSRSTILIVSHDRVLLNQFDITVELSKFGLAVFGGNYDFYRVQKEGKLSALQSQLDEQSKSLRQAQQKARDMAAQRQKKEARGKTQGMTNSLPRIVAGGLKSKAEQSTARLLDAHQEKTSDISANIQQLREHMQQYQVLRINIGSSELHRGKLLIDAMDINYNYGRKWLWESLSFQVRSGERVRVTGKNGTGKTTLISIITGEAEPCRGKLIRNDFQYLYLDQDYTLIRGDLTVFQQLSTYNSLHLEEHQLRSLLLYTQFPAESWDRKCDNLSGGEKMKLSLCCLSVVNHKPDMLILDEPTNNLDLKSLEILEAALKTFKGTLIVVSHDRQFIEGIGIEREIKL